jgi:hypothetical protein
MRVRGRTLGHEDEHGAALNNKHHAEEHDIEHALGPVLLELVPDVLCTVPAHEPVGFEDPKDP